MNLNFISSSRLIIPYDKNKYQGIFVYLTNEQDNYRPGLYLGGIDDWEKLSNDYFSEDEELVNTTNYLPLPSESDLLLIYNGAGQSYYPSNWSMLSRYCTISNNNFTNVGTYTCFLDIAETGRMWIDGTTTPKEVEFTVYPMNVTNCDITLSSDSVTFGNSNPTIASIVVSGMNLTENVDYDVLNPSNGQCGEKTLFVIFKGNYTGSAEKKYTIVEKIISSPTWTGVYSYAYDGSEHTIIPDNWDDISDYCYISSNRAVDVGTYTSTITLNDKNNTIWDTGNVDDKNKTFTITPKFIDIPVWRTNYISTFDGNSVNILPDNWEDISSYCDISGNTEYKAGNYTIVVSLKKSKYKWSDNDTSNKTKEYTIDYLYINNPEWESEYNFTYNSRLREIYPTNWDQIDEYCTILGNSGTSVGDYTATVALKDTLNTKWLNEYVTNTSKSFVISKMDGYFICDATLSYSSTNINETLTVHSNYVDETATILYKWYRSDDSFENALGISGADSTSYILTPDDYDKYIYVEVIALPTSNYTGSNSIARIQRKVRKIQVLDFGFTSKNDSILNQTQYTLPDLNIKSDMDGSVITYTVLEGNDIVDDISSSGVVSINTNWTGTVVIKAEITGSDTYDYIPDTDTFTLTVLCDEIVYYGMYDKSVYPDMITDLENGSFPANKKIANVTKINGDICFNMSITEFDENINYYGWYLLVDKNSQILELKENGYMTLDPETYDLSSELTDENSKIFKAYGRFGIAKYSDNWYMDCKIRK